MSARLLFAASVAAAMSAACGARSGLVPAPSRALDDASALDAPIDEMREDDAQAREASIIAAFDASVAEASTADASAAEAAVDASLTDAAEIDAAMLDSTPPDGRAHAVDGDADAGCDPFTVTDTIPFAPTILDTGALFFSIESTGCAAGSTPPRACNNAVLLTPEMTLSDTCAALANRVDTSCGSGVTAADFRVDATECASGVLTIVDPACKGRGAPNEGLSLVLSSTRSTSGTTSRAADFERDQIANGCSNTAGALVVLSGTATGTGIVGSSNVELVVTTNDVGVVVATTPTAAGLTANALAATAIGNANASLQARGSTASCEADPRVPSLVTCTESTDAAGLSLVVNDTGLDRVVAAGPTTSMAAANRVLDQAGGLQDVLQLNFVGGETCQPCAGDGAGSCCE